MEINEIVRYLFSVSVRYFKRSDLLFHERFGSFVNELKINDSFRLITESSFDFQKLSFVNETLPSPTPNRSTSGVSRIPLSGLLFSEYLILA